MQITRLRVAPQLAAARTDHIKSLAKKNVHKIVYRCPNQGLIRRHKQVLKTKMKEL